MTDITLSTAKPSMSPRTSMGNLSLTTTVSGNFATVEEEADYIIILFNTLGIMFFIFAVLYIVSAICAFVARKINSIGMYIVSLVFGIGNGLLIVGSILGLISTSKGTSKVEE